MDAAQLIKQARSEAGLTLRSLAELAGTSHSTLSAYESGTKTPNVATLNRILRAAGFVPDVQLGRRIRTASGLSRADELIAVLELAAAFPTRHDATLQAPIFGRTDS